MKRASPRRILRVHLAEIKPPGNNGQAFRCDCPANGGDSKLSRIMTDADGHASFIMRDVIDSVRHSFTKFLVGKIMSLYLFGIALSAVRPARILHFSQRFLLFCVHGDGRTACTLERFHTLADMLKLSISIGMLLAFNRFTVCLQAIAAIVQQPAHRIGTH